MSNDHSFLEKDSLKSVLRWGSRLLTLAIVGFLFYRLRQLGWQELWSALPTNPWFYVLFVVIYLTLPVADLLVYRQVWPIPVLDGLRAFLKKRVFNEEMTGYSGEVYLYWWLSQRSEISRSEAFRVVRDNNILSSVASMTVAFGLVGILALTGLLLLGPLLGRINGSYAAIGAVAVVVVVIVAFKFRHSLFSLSRPVAYRILGIHYGRLLGANALIALQWSVGAPGISISVWLTYLSILIVLNRIPFLPSKDLFFLSASVELSSMMGIATTAIAGILVASSVLVRSTNVLIFIATYFFGRNPLSTDPAVADGDAMIESA
ncbi:MAG: hypothetical protein BMS9Abin05_0075 [Rhodothermia bacterium]|nr:MAG: hypothetical protein BMS9Abin05_0075 [Rhodothermia bacterium]